MPLDTGDVNENSVSIHVHDRPPLIRDRRRFTIVVALAQDEAMALIADLAKSAWAGGTHLVIEADAITYPRDAPE